MTNEDISLRKLLGNLTLASIHHIEGWIDEGNLFTVPGLDRVTEDDSLGGHTDALKS
jgi:hypothetical protein